MAMTITADMVLKLTVEYGDDVLKTSMVMTITWF